MQQPFIIAKGLMSAALLLSLCAGPVSAAPDPELIGRGGAIAAAHCGKCHSVGQADASPQKITPPFRTLGERYPIEMLVEAQKSGEIGGHDEMPMFNLGVDGVAALLAYIDSLTPAGPHYLPVPK